MSKKFLPGIFFFVNGNAVIVATNKLNKVPVMVINTVILKASMTLLDENINLYAFKVVSNGIIKNRFERYSLYVAIETVATYQNG